ncbi:MAG: putative mannosyltransferase [Ferruginibacter sp.]|nr:putative mannosyltransferase [Ferruginibacter sp.]
MDKQLHIVMHDVPWPADYGGVVDLFYTLTALHKAGVGIHLHCFTNRRPQQTELEKYCVTVHYYRRKTGAAGLSFRLPYIVNSRRNDELINNLLKDDHPILLEGIHSSFYLNSGQLSGRKIFLRLYNVEHEYYRHLAKHEKNPLKKLYYSLESRLLKKYEKAVSGKATILPLSTTDLEQYKSLFQPGNISFLPVFLPWQRVNTVTGNGCFCLYHGNLSVSENEKAALWLLREVWQGIDIPLVIAGKDPSQALLSYVKDLANCCVVANPGENEMQDMIRKAQVHVLPSFNNTGVKLKLLNALFNGRHCLVNEAGVKGSGVETLVEIAGDTTAYRQSVAALYQQAFSEEDIEKRAAILSGIYNNDENARRLIAWIY